MDILKPNKFTTSLHYSWDEEQKKDILRWPPSQQKLRNRERRKTEKVNEYIERERKTEINKRSEQNSTASKDPENFKRPSVAH